MSMFKDWLMDKFTEWERAQKHRQSYSAFARYLGVKQSALSHWMNGNYTPTGENLVKVASILGPEVYTALGLVSPEESHVPPPVQSAYDRASERVKSLGIPADSDESERIFIEELSKVGYKVISRTES